MINVILRETLESSVLSLSFNDYFIIVIDSSYNLYIYERSNFKLANQKKIISREKHFQFHKGVEVQDSTIHLTLSKSNKSALLLYDSKVKKLGTFNIHKAYIDTSTISQDGEYLATGGQDGKVFVFDLNSKNLITSLPQKTDYIANIIFSDDSEFIAVSSFDQTTTIYNFYRNNIQGEFKTESVVEVFTFFDNNKRLFAIERDGVVISYDIYTKEILYKEHYFDDWPTTLTKTECDKYVLVGTREGYLHGIRLKDNKSIFSIQIRSQGITTLTLDRSRLIVGFSDGIIEVISFDKYAQEANEAIENEDFQEAKNYLDKNVLLNMHSVINTFDDSWEYVQEQMRILLARNDLKAIHVLAAPFLDNQKRMEEFTQFITKKDILIKFTKAAETKNYLRCYILADEHTELKAQEQYSLIEDNWFKAFNRAKKEMYANPGAKEKVIEATKEFGTVPNKKPIILLLLSNPNVFKKAELFVVKKNFKNFFDWVEIYPQLKELDLYTKILANGRKVIEDAKKHEENRDFNEAIRTLKLIIDFSPLAEEVENHLVHLGNSLNFVKHVNNKNLRQSYRLIEQNPDFKEFVEFEELNKIFKKRVKLAMKYAFAGVPAKLFEIFKEYIEITYHQDKIISIFKIAYLNEIKKAVEGKFRASWGETIRHYISLYGKDMELEHYAANNRLINVYKAVEDKEEIEKITPKELPKSIIVLKS